MARGLDGKVVVITGASSGIGRAAARAFADEGAAVVLAARREPLLHEAASEVIEAGGRAMSVPTDVRDPAQVQRLADRAVEAFGGIDIWVNNAGISSFGKFEDTPPEVFAAVMATTFDGVVNGFRAALPHMRERRRGTIITTASVAGRLPAPYHAAYGAAKHAVLGFVESVREEIRQDGLADIHVCSVLPGPVDTPFWQHAANFSGRGIKVPSPPSAPEDVARALVGLAMKPRREVGVGAPSWLVELSMAVAQGPTERGFGRQMSKGLFTDRPTGRSEGAVMRPMPEGTGASGGWRDRDRDRDRRRGHRRAMTRGSGLVTGAIAVAVPLGIAALYGWPRSSRRG
jgi:NAD(P)-dependent dehydrogenase (short-subunit alcohol dehydrogenase family)